MSFLCQNFFQKPNEIFSRISAHDMTYWKNCLFPLDAYVVSCPTCTQILEWYLVQGVSHWKVSFKMALPDRNMQVRFCWKVSVYSWGLEIWISSTSFQKSTIGWPQQPPTEKVPYISENLDFWWSIPQKRTSVGHFGAIDDQTIRIRKFFEDIGLLKPVKSQRLLRSMRLHRLENHYWGLQSHPESWIQ